MIVVSGGILKSAPAVAALLLAGCGGNDTGVEKPSNVTYHLYATGTAGKTYSHVWVTIQRAILTNGVSSMPVFDASASGGLKVDLSSLSDKAGPLFLYLGSKDFETGLFSSARLILSNQITLVPASGTTASVAKLTNSKDANATIDVDLAKFKPASPGFNVVLNFDSSIWKLSAGLLTGPKGHLVTIGSSAGMLDPARHVTQTLAGSVVNLDGTGRTRAFSLKTVNGTIDVESAAMAKGDKPNREKEPPISEGEQVLVTGTFDPSASTFRASAIAPAEPRSPLPPSGRSEKQPSAGSKH
jgi:hypothetical protein